MSKLTKRLSALLLVICLLLTGCAEEESGRRRKKKDDDEKQTQAKQLPQEELEIALQTLDFSAIAAAAAKDELGKALDGQYIDNYRAHIGDIDGDGEVEMVYGWSGVTFDPSNGGSVSEYWEQSGNTFYIDKDGKLYLEGSMSGEWPDGYLWYFGSDRWYKTWDGSHWNQVFSFGCTEGYVGGADGIPENAVPDEREASGTIGDKQVTEEEYNAYIEEIGLQKLETTAADLTVHSYDIAYQEQLLEELDAHLAEQYTNYTASFTGDYDNDGVEETLFVIPDILYTWKNKIVESEMPEWDSEREINSNIDLSITRTGVILADPQEDTLVFRAFCINDYLNANDSLAITYENTCMYVGGYPCYDGITFTTLDSLDDATRTQVLMSLQTRLQEYDYSNPVMKLVDIADSEGQELLCLCKKDGAWYLMVFVFRNGTPQVILSIELTNTAYYLVEKDGKQCLMSYYQRISSTGGGYNADYSYNIMRFDSNGNAQSLEYKNASFTDRDSNAAQTSSFFDSFNRYITKVVVVADPFVLTNQQWLSQDQADSGTVPEDTVTMPEEEAEIGKLGFVDIEDPESWLNLREGPGTQYSQVLMDPYNPNSFVKQALGSPVTVLEEIVTGDSENPVWVKIRIHYGNREIVGYSSKRYIRMAE